MAAQKYRKIKLVKELEIIRSNTDAEHPMTIEELRRQINALGISCNDKTIGQDMMLLIESGYPVRCSMLGHKKAFYIDDNRFSIPELKVLMDAVQAAGFISEDYTNKLIEKIAALGGIFKAELLTENIVHFNTRKHNNDSVFENISVLTQALKNRSRASFFYFDLNENRERVYRYDHKLYEVEPIALVYESSYYYLLSYNTDKNKTGETVSYRIDRMDGVKCEPKNISHRAQLEKNRLDGYTSRVINMFAGPERMATLRFHDSLIGAVFDRFGEKTTIRRISNDTCEATVRVQISPTLLGWVYQFGEKMTLKYNEFL